MGKTILSVLGVLSLVWIGYVCINLSSLENQLTPATVFGQEDASVVIVHKPLEPDYAHPDYAFLSKDPFYAGLLTHTERIQHFYFSSSRAVVLLERSKPWTIELIDQYFGSLGISSTVESTKEIRLSNGWHVLFNKEYMHLSKAAEYRPVTSSIDWKYVDRKSSCTLIRWKEGKPEVENAYRSSMAELTYISRNASGKPIIADDQEIFQDVIPDGFKSLEFFEKNYLQSLAPNQQYLFEWMENGAVKIRYNNRFCIITDCIPGQDPIAILGSKLNDSAISDDKKKAEVKGISLPQQFFSSPEWYLEVFNGRVFIAEDEQAINDVIGAYETGKTLSQNQELRLYYFSRAPKRVSYRSITPENIVSMSNLKGSRHTVVQQLKETTNETEAPEENEEETTEAIRIQGGIAQLIPVQGSDFLYVLSKENLLYGISDGKEKWKLLLPDAVVGEAQLANDGGDLLVTTTTSVHRVTRAGAERNGTPVKLTKTPVTQVVHYTWKGASYYAVADAGSLSIYTESGTQKTTIRLPFTPGNSAFIVWSNAGDLTATIAGSAKGVNISIDRKRKVNEFQLPAGAFFPVKVDKGVAFVGIKQAAVVSVNHKGIVTTIAKGGYRKIVRVLRENDTPIIIAQAGKKIIWLSPQGQVLGSISPTFDDISSAHIQTGHSGKTIVILLDGIANKNYIYNANGQQFSTELYDGNEISALHRQSDGKLRIISQSNNYLVRYPIEN